MQYQFLKDNRIVDNSTVWWVMMRVIKLPDLSDKNAALPRAVGFSLGREHAFFDIKRFPQQDDLLDR